MAVTRIDKTGKAVGTIELAPAFAQRAAAPLLHQAVVRHLANRRAGTADTKTRDEVSGGGKKPWRQKGTGRARHGSIRSPIWRKGGVVFGPHPRSFAIGMTRKARRKALAMAIGAKAEAGVLFILDAAGFEAAKTKDAIALFGSARDKGSALVVHDAGKDQDLGSFALAARNIKHATMIALDDISVHAVLSHDRVFLTQNAYDALTEVCGA